MNELALIEDLNRLLALETRGLLRFLDCATPHLTPQTFKVWGEIQTMANTTVDRGRRLTELLNSLEAPVRPASFDIAVANYHYTTLEPLLPLLANESKSIIDVYQGAIERASHHPNVRGELMVLLAESQGRLEKFEAHTKSLALGSTPQGAK